MAVAGLCPADKDGWHTNIPVLPESIVVAADTDKTAGPDKR